MDIFNEMATLGSQTTQSLKQRPRRTQNSKRLSHGEGMAPTKRVKQPLSPDQIRAKVAAHRIEKNGDQAFTAELSKPATPTQNKPAAEMQEQAEKLDPNDPSSTLTTDKLKKALQAGAISWSPQEREVLGKILQNR